MSGLAAILAGRERPGVHRWVSGLDVQDVADAVHSAGWAFAHVDGWTTGSTKAELLAEIGRALEFPEHYGHNLDALHDCLRDVGTGGHGVVLLWDGWATLARADRRSFDAVVDILAERADRESAPFTVLLRGEGPETPDVPLVE